MTFAARRFSTSAETATQSGVSSGWTEGDFLPGVMALTTSSFARGALYLRDVRNHVDVP